MDEQRRPRGEPPASERPPSTSVLLVVRVSLAQRQKLSQIASLNGLDRSAFVRQAIDSATLDCSDDPIFGA
ncbi:MAG: hypothetical protein AB7Q29_19250 [Vicinamibacterales bacterium]